jgi:hypothetical protein
LSTMLNLLDLCHGRRARVERGIYKTGQPVTNPVNIAVEITLVDERDGFCESRCCYTHADG